MSNVILIGQNKDLALPYNEEYGKVLNKASLKSINDVIDDERFLVKPEVGMVFIKHPFLDVFIPNDENLELEIYRHSIQEVFNLAQDLGAISCTYDLTIEQKSFLGFKMKGSVKSPQGDADAQCEGHVDNNFWQQLNMRYKNYRVDGSTILSMEEYEKAKNRLENSEYLKRDPQAKDMLERRNPASRTQREEMHLTYALSKDMNEDLAIAAKLKGAGGALKIKGSYTKNKKITKRVVATYTIKFVES